MKATERKKKTEDLLKSLNIPFIDHLPLIEEESEANIRSAQEIARRILVLTYLNYVAEEPEDRAKIVAFLKEENLWESVSGEEKEMFLRDLSDKERVSISWRSESLWLLLWAINKVDKLELPSDEISIPEILQRLPGFLEQTEDFVQSSQVRTVSEILDMSDLLYRLHWATTHTELNILEALDLNSSVVYERHYAINWVTYYAEDWDDITTDT